MRINFLSLILLFSTNLLFSQVQFGVTGGMGYVNTARDFEPESSKYDYFGFDYSYRISYLGGAYCTYSLSDNFKLRTEFLFSSKGGRYEFNDAGSNVNINLRLSYISIPVLFQLRLVDELSLEIGPEIGYLLAASVKRKGFDSFDVDNLYNNETDFGISSGFRYFITQKITTSLRYTHGLSTIREDNIFDSFAIPSGNVSFHNRSFQLSVSYGLN